MYAKKSLGQHFLKSERALRVIVETGSINSSDTILEIGPGTGSLTEKLLETGVNVVAVEKDGELFKSLEQKFVTEIKSGQLVLIHDDVLDLKIENLKIENYKLIANIPYNITGAIIKKFLEENSQPTQMVLLVQKEVAERIVAKDGKESILSISVKVYGTPKFVEVVKAGSFAPMPSVDSAIISIENISKEFFFTPPELGGVSFSENDFFKILKAGFKSKRKKLSSNLSTVLEKNVVTNAFLEIGFDENLRAEDLNVLGWQKLASLLCK